MTFMPHAPARRRPRAARRPCGPSAGGVTGGVSSGVIDGVTAVSSPGVIDGVIEPSAGGVTGGVIDGATGGGLEDLSVTEIAVALAASGLPAGSGPDADLGQIAAWARAGLARLGPDETWRRAWRTWCAGPAEAAVLWPGSGPSFSACTALALRIHSGGSGPLVEHDGTECTRRDREFARRLGWPPSYAPPGSDPDHGPYYCAGDGS